MEKRTESQQQKSSEENSGKKGQKRTKKESVQSRKLADEIKKPHDGLFQGVFVERESGTGVIKNYVPEQIVSGIDLDSWYLERCHFVDKKINQTASDVVYRVDFKNEKAWIYFLFEHQSSYSWQIPQRMLSYMNSLWVQILGANPEYKSRQKLPPIFPILLYHGKKSWGSAFFQDYLDIPEVDKKVLSPFLPQFQFVLINLPKMELSEIKGGLTGKIAMRLMKASCSGKVETTVEIIQATDSLFGELIKRDDGKEQLERFLLYMYSTMDQEVEQELNNILDRSQHREIKERKMRSIAQKWLDEEAEKAEKRGIEKGILEGKIEEKMETAKKMKEEKADLHFIAKITNLPTETIERL